MPVTRSKGSIQKDAKGTRTGGGGWCLSCRVWEMGVRVWEVTNSWKEGLFTEGLGPAGITGLLSEDWSDRSLLGS